MHESKGACTVHFFRFILGTISCSTANRRQAKSSRAQRDVGMAGFLTIEGHC